MTLNGHIHDGKVVLDTTPGVPDGTPVLVTIVTPPAKEVREIPTLYERMKLFIGAIDDLPPDASRNIDHYLYGHPKK